MYRWLAEKLGNVSVNRKLGIGFGLVLILTLLITFTGWTGLSGVISRGDKLGYISSLNGLTKDLRLARLDFEMRRGEQGTGAVNDLITQLDTGLKTAAELIEQPDDKLLVEQQQDALGQYKKAFGSMVQAGLKREGARSKLGDTADNAVAKTNEVEKSLLQGDSVTLFNRVVDLSKLIQQARFQVRGYTYSGKNVQGWGYAVFGKVTEGQDVVDKIKGVQTTGKAGHQDVPVEDVIVEKAEIVE